MLGGSSDQTRDPKNNKAKYDGKQSNTPRNTWIQLKHTRYEFTREIREGEINSPFDYKRQTYCSNKNFPCHLTD